ncbi:MAG TPA: methyltransferase domain-containing protein [Cystobacter sp.]
MKTETIHRAYGQASQYEQVMKTEWEPITPRAQTMEWLELQPGGRLLEACVGSGLNFAYYPPQVNVVGIDFTPEMLALAASKLPLAGRSIELMHMDATHMSFADESFDAVLETYALCVVPRPLEVLREMARVCKRGGKVVLFDCIRSELPVVARNQELIKPFCMETGIPAGVIVWDPTRDYLELARDIPELELSRIVRFNQDDVFASRCLIQFTRK